MRDMIQKRLAFNLLIAAVLFLLPLRGSLVFASDAGKSKPKPRTLKETVDFAISHGVDHDLDAFTAKQFGFKGAMPAKSLWYGGTQTSDGYDHYLDVIYLSSASKHIEPLALVWTNYKKTVADDKITYDKNSFLSTSTAKLQNAVHGEGVPGHVKQIPVPIDSGAHKNFEFEKKFFMIESISLIPNK